MWIALIWIAVCTLAGFTVWLLHDLRGLLVLLIMLFVQFHSGISIKKKRGGEQDDN